MQNLSETTNCTQLQPILLCPECKTGNLSQNTDDLLSCSHCDSTFPIKDDVPRFVSFNNNGEDTAQNSFNYWDGGIPGTVENGYQHGKVHASYPSKEWFLEGDTVRYNQYKALHDFCEFEKYKDKKILDIGPGRGQETHNYLSKGGNVTVLEYATQGVKLVQDRLNTFGVNANILQADASRIPIKDNTFDLVFSYGVLHHIPDMEKSIEEVYRVLKPGGTAKIMIYHKGLFYYKDMFLKWYLLKGNFIKHSWSEYIKVAMEQKPGKCPVVYIGDNETIKKQFDKFELVDFFNDEIMESRLLRWNIVPQSFIKKYRNSLGAYCHLTLRKPANN